MHESNQVVEVILGLSTIILLGSAIHSITKKINWMPYPVALLALGISISTIGASKYLHTGLDPHVVLYIFLPILLFESAYQFEFKEFRRILLPAFVLATVGLVISAIFIALPLYLLVDVEPLHALLFGAVISSTDPIAVLTILKKLGIPHRLQLLVDAESFLNDATSVVFYRIILGAILVTEEAGRSTITLQSDLIASVANFIFVLGGGILAGIILGFIFSEIISQIKNESNIETALTIVLAGLVFLIAEHYLKVSGIIAVLAAGMVMGNYGITKISPKVQHTMHKQWEFLGFIVTTVIFVAMGLEIHLEHFKENIGIIAITILTMTLSRIFAVNLLVIITNRFTAKPDRIPLRWIQVISWSGLRGVLPLVIIYSLPEDFTNKELFIQITLASIIFTILVNALSMDSLVKLLKLNRTNLSTNIESIFTQITLLNNLNKYLHSIHINHEIGEKVYSTHTEEISNKLIIANAQLHALKNAEPEKFSLELNKVLKKFALRTETKLYSSLYKREVISEEIYQKLIDSIEVQINNINLEKDQFRSKKEMEHKIKKLANSRKSLNAILNQIKPGKLERAAKAAFIYYKSRLLGDEYVIKNLRNLKVFSKDKLLKPELGKVINQYEELLTYNQETLNLLEKNYAEMALSIDENFYQCEMNEHIGNAMNNLLENRMLSQQAYSQLKQMV